MKQRAKDLTCAKKNTPRALVIFIKRLRITQKTTLRANLQAQVLSVSVRHNYQATYSYTQPESIN